MDMLPSSFIVSVGDDLVKGKTKNLNQVNRSGNAPY